MQTIKQRHRKTWMFNRELAFAFATRFDSTTSFVLQVATFARVSSRSQRRRRWHRLLLDQWTVYQRDAIPRQDTFRVGDVTNLSAVGSLLKHDRSSRNYSLSCTKDTSSESASPYLASFAQIVRLIKRKSL